MSDEDALLRAVREAPDEDAPRLVYADWLEEHGEPDRAELIRVQCDLARLPKDDPRRAGLGRRNAELFRAHRDEWLRPLRVALDTSAQRQFGYEIFDRGFVGHLTLLPARPSYLADAADFLRRHPVRSLFIDSRGPLDPDSSLMAVAERPELDNLRELNCGRYGGAVRSQTLRALGRAPHLARLRELSLSPSLAPAGVRELADSLLGRLTALSLSLISGHGREGLEYLTGSPAASGLESLSLWNWLFGNPGMQMIAECPHLPKLRQLAVGGCGVSWDGMEMLVASPLAGQLTSLTIGHNPIGVSGSSALAASPLFGRLEKLHLAYSNLHNDGLAALLASPHRPRLSELWLGGNNLTAGALPALLASPMLAEIKHLGLFDNPLGYVGAALVAEAPILGGLESLNLASCGIGNTGARALMHSPHLHRELNLSLTAEGLSPETQAALRKRFPSVELR